MGKEAVRLSTLRMPMPATTPALPNPVAELTKTGTGSPAAITKVEAPEHEYDGTRCLVHFAPVAGATGYDVWASPYPDGRGALRLGMGWTAPGQLLTGLPAHTDIYLFVVATVNGKTTPPSAGFKVNLADMFPMK
jgi:hypothetical protein